MLQLSQQRVRCTQIDFARPVAAQLAAQRAIHHDAAGGELIYASLHLAAATLAAHHEHGVPDAGALRAAVIHAHSRTLREGKANVQPAQKPVQAVHKMLWWEGRAA